MERRSKNNNKSSARLKQSAKRRGACSMCGSDKSDSFIDLNTTEYLQSGLQKDWNLKPDLLKKKLSSICVECVCKLQATAGRKSSGMKGTSIRRATTLKSASNIDVATRKLEVSTKSSTKATTVSPPTSNKKVLPCATNSKSTKNKQSSDGLVSEKKTVNPKWHTNLVCQYCKRSYFRKDYYTSHVRRCWRKHASLGKDARVKEMDENVFYFKKHCGFCGRRTLTTDEFEAHMTICLEKHKDHIESKLIMRRKTALAVASNQAISSHSAYDSRRRDTIGAGADTKNLENKSAFVFKVANKPRQDFSTAQSVKEFDLNQLDILKRQVKLSTFNCLVYGCGYITKTLEDLMRHDFKTHWKCSWFYCHKCSGVFTSKVFLDYHLDRQDKGRYVCYKCSKKFKLQHQLDRHLLQHTKSINYICTYCHKEFLSEQKLSVHTGKKRHNPQSSRKLIHIERDLTIGLMSPTPPPEKLPYEARLLTLPSMPMASKRPMQLPKHKPYRHFFGKCDFKNYCEPNCIGCQ